ncbi:uncharacterized protein LOC131997870 [Stomoxys calcitrans]|uniref:uncharacterized protein LOC131997870 n=1 Tax=Stomoxys calcitrans TaxID=35570 RepID=UPI0027E28FA2|nr:uncharacterized protein LOC131997870 [Stomoxys calcitrans]
MLAYDSQTNEIFDPMKEIVAKTFVKNSLVHRKSIGLLLQLYSHYRRMMCAISLKFLIISLLYQEVKLIIQIDRINCSSNNVAFSSFEMCRLRYYKANCQEFSFYIKMLKTVTHCDTRLEAIYLTPKIPVKLLNLSFDACEILQSSKKFSAARRIFDIVAKKTNFNHTCPYAHNVFGSNITLDSNQIPYVQLNGKYSVKATFNINHGANIIVVEGFGKVV